MPRGGPAAECLPVTHVDGYGARARRPTHRWRITRRVADPTRRGGVPAGRPAAACHDRWGCHSGDFWTCSRGAATWQGAARRVGRRVEHEERPPASSGMAHRAEHKTQRVVACRGPYADTPRHCLCARERGVGELCLPPLAGPIRIVHSRACMVRSRVASWPVSHSGSPL